MANLLESSQTAATTAPGYYTDYLSNLASAGKTAATNAQYVGAQPLQEKAFTNVENLTSTYKPTLTSAGDTLTSAAGYKSPLDAGATYLSQAEKSPAQRAQDYMSPYLENVVDAIGDVGKRNIQQNLAPGATSAAVGSGQFGSQRGAQVLGQTLSNAERDILNQQYQAQNAGYGAALTAAGQQNALLGQLGSTAGQQAYQGMSGLTAAGQAQAELAAKQQGLGLGDINALSTLGGQQQTIAQNKELFPLQNLTTTSGLLRGYTFPTSTKTTAQASPLSTVGTLATGTVGFFTKDPKTGLTPYDSLVAGLKNAYNSIGGSSAPSTTVDVSKGYVTPSGNLLSYGPPITGTGLGGSAGAGQVVGTDGKIYADPTYGNTSGYDNGPVDGTDLPPLPEPSDNSGGGVEAGSGDN